MNTAAHSRQTYRAMLARFGELVTLRRGTAPSVTLQARISGYQPDEMVGGVQQGDSRVVFLAADLGDFPLPIKTGSTDAIFLGARKMTVQAVDDLTRRAGRELVAYELRVRG